MWMRIVVAIVSAMALAGCYTSKEMLLDMAQARQPLTSREWSTTDARGAVTYFRLTLRGDGQYDYQSKLPPLSSSPSSAAPPQWAAPYVILVNDLGFVNGRNLYVYGVRFGKEYNVYGLLYVKPGGGWSSVQPDCIRQGDRAIAVRNGGTAKECEFASRAALLAALKEYAASPSFSERLLKP